MGPALALDLMEVRPSDFITTGRAVALRAAVRKGLLRAYEQRMDNLVTHPDFGYRVSYRRVLEVQARLFGSGRRGELSNYPGFETR